MQTDDLAHLVKTHRQKAGLTQTELATLAGVGKTVIWNIEHGRETVQWNILKSIFRVLNITVEWRSRLLDRPPSDDPNMASSVSVSASSMPSLDTTSSHAESRTPV